MITGRREIPAFLTTFIGNASLRYRISKPSSELDTVCSTLRDPSARDADARNEAGSQITCATNSRRALLRNIGIVTASMLLSNPHVDTSLADEGTQFSIYKGPVSLGYSFSYPSSWSVKKKPIKTHLSEIIVTDNDESSTSAGLVVDAVKIDSIDKFGPPDAVGQKVVAVESKKESVKDAYVTSASAISKGGLTYYIIDYTVDSTRGFKRYKAKATVSGNQLYVFTAQAKVDNFNDAVEKTITKMLDSFDVVQQFL